MEILWIETAPLLGISTSEEDANWLLPSLTRDADLSSQELEY